VADRFALRRLIIATQAVSGVLAAVLWGLAVAGRLSVGVIVGVGVVGGFVQIVDSPARQALVGSLVPPDDLSSAVSLNGVLAGDRRRRRQRRRWGASAALGTRGSVSRRRSARPPRCRAR
jgi:MFS family permease